jgi:hypothetical protein
MGIFAQQDAESGRCQRVQRHAMKLPGLVMNLTQANHTKIMMEDKPLRLNYFMTQAM